MHTRLWVVVRQWHDGVRSSFSSFCPLRKCCPKRISFLIPNMVAASGEQLLGPDDVGNAPFFFSNWSATVGISLSLFFPLFLNFLFF